MGFEQTDRHIHHQLHYIPLLPCTIYFRIRICLCIGLQRLSIHRERSLFAPFRIRKKSEKAPALRGTLSNVSVPFLPRDNPSLCVNASSPLSFPSRSQRICTIQVTVNAFRTQCRRNSVPDTMYAMYSAGSRNN